MQTSTDFCTYPQATPVTSSQSGHLASLVTEMTGCGGVTTPWIIEVSPGQVVRLTLYDFGVVRSKKGFTRPASTQCHTYAILREPGQLQPGPGGVIRTVRNVTVCGGSMRQSVVYVTVTNRLEIGLVRNDNLIYGPHFMFEYHGIYPLSVFFLLILIVTFFCCYSFYQSFCCSSSYSQAFSPPSFHSYRPILVLLSLSLLLCVG